MLSNSRPDDFNKFIGQELIKNNLKIYINSAKNKQKNLDHCLIYGPPGVGKTSLAKVISNEFNSNIKVIQGPEIKTKADIINAIINLRDNDFLFIDEIHAINVGCFELLYSIMEDYQMNISIGKEGNSKFTVIETPRITIIGATTLLGNIPNPLEERFPIVINLKPYSNSEIFTLLLNLLDDKNLLSKEEIIYISKMCKGIPRIAKHFLARVIDFKTQQNISIEEIFERLEIYDLGLNKTDIEYLKLFLNKQNYSIKSISQILNIDEKTILLKIEPYLIRIGFILKTHCGRTITNQGLDYINKILKKQ